MSLLYFNNNEIKFGTGTSLNGVETPGEESKELRSLEALSLLLQNGCQSISNGKYAAMSNQVVGSTSYTYNNLFAGQMLLYFKKNDKFLAYSNEANSKASSYAKNLTYLAEITEKESNYFKIHIYDYEGRTYKINVATNGNATVDFDESTYDNGVHMTSTATKDLISNFKFVPLTLRSYTSNRLNVYLVAYSELSSTMKSNLSTFYSGTQLTDKGTTALTYAGTLSDIPYINAL